jgi:hypothetical protein
MKVYFSNDEARAVKRCLKGSVDLYSRAIRSAHGPMRYEYSPQKLRAYQRHLSTLQAALRRLTPSGGAIMD